MKVTKLQAAGALLDSAIDAFLRDDFVTAIHCAGAAEDLCGKELVRRGGSRTLDRWWERGDCAGIVDDKTKFISAMNMARDWVKHTNPSHR